MTLSGPPPRTNATPSSEIAAAIDWWRGAGVDLDYSDEALNWLAEPEPAVTAPPVETAPARPVPAPPPPAPKIGGEAAGWPQDLPAFAAWWLAEPSLDSGQVFDRVPPRGPATAELMVLVDHPEAGDSGLLLAGPQGRLLAGILSALQIAPEQVYFASLLPRHMPMPDWAALAAAGIGDLALHHVNLAAPKRLLSFGPHVSSLLGHDPAKSADALRNFYRVGANVPALAAPALGTMMARPRGKAALWRDLLDWRQA